MNRWRIFTITIPYLDGEIKFTIGETSPIKIKYTFSIDLNKEIAIYPKDWQDRNLRIFGLKELKSGFPDFDKKFIIKGNDESFIKKILDNKIVEFLLNIDNIASLRIESINSQSVLKLNAPFHDANFKKMEDVIQFIKNIVNNILCNDH